MQGSAAALQDSDYHSAEEYDSDSPTIDGATTDSDGYGSSVEAIQEEQHVMRHLSPVLQDAERAARRDFTKIELEQVAQLRRELPDSVLDSTMVRFLRARDHNLETAKTLLLKHVAFREKHGLDALDFSQVALPSRGYIKSRDSNAEESLPSIRTLVDVNPNSVHYWSRKGEPLFIYSPGNVNVYETLKRATPEEACMFATHVCEFIGTNLLSEALERALTPAERKNSTGMAQSLTVIMDMKDLGMRQLYMPALNYFRYLIPLYEENYPESLGTVMVINAPRIFQMFWSFLGPLIPEKTKQRILILGSDHLEEVVKRVKPEFIPSIYGGLCTCRCPGGCLSPIRDPNYCYDAMDEKGVWRIAVGGGKSAVLPIAVPAEELARRPGSQLALRWSLDLPDKASFRFGYMPNFDVHIRDHPDALKDTPYDSLDLPKSEMTLGEATGSAGWQYAERIVREPGLYGMVFHNPTWFSLTVRVHLYE